MRINKYLALSSGLSRRSIDSLIQNGKITVNGKTAQLGQQVEETDHIKLNGELQTLPASFTTILFNKPRGYVVSKKAQGTDKTIYDIIDKKYSDLKPVGRLDKDSSGLLLLTNDGDLSYKLTHPSFRKVKIYNIELDKDLEPLHQQMISDYGVALSDGPSRLRLTKLQDPKHFEVQMSEGRNRQIRRTFKALGYEVVDLHRTVFGDYVLGDLKEGEYKELED